MRLFDSKKTKYLVFMASIIVLILAIFNTIITIKIHKQIVPIVSRPDRWPVGAYIYDKKIGFDFASNISGTKTGSNYNVKSHTFGYRLSEYEDSDSYEPGGILSLGCSYTYGDEVRSDQTFTHYAADSLELDAYNYGICSFSYIHALLKAEKLKDQGILDKLRPKYVVLGCWNGLPDRSRSPFPPLASGGPPVPTAYLAKTGDDVRIKYPMKIQSVFDLVDLYRKEGTDLTFKKFVKIYLAAPRYIILYSKYNKLVQGIKTKSFKNDVSDYEIYDFYFSGIESVFSDYNSRIIVLYMPFKRHDEPPKALQDALAKHPGILFANGLTAIDKYGVQTRDYQSRHPQPAAHAAYGRAIIDVVRSGDKQ